MQLSRHRYRSANVADLVKLTLAQREAPVHRWNGSFGREVRVRNKLQPPSSSLREDDAVGVEVWREDLCGI